MKILAETKYNKEGFYLQWSTDFLDGQRSSFRPTNNDIQVILKDPFGEYCGDAVCRWGSYGVENNLWEVALEHPPVSWGESVKGHLTWKEVEKYFDREVRLFNLKEVNI